MADGDVPWRAPDGWARLSAWLAGADDPEMTGAVLEFLADPEAEAQAEAG